MTIKKKSEAILKKRNLDWYIKWVATVLILISVSFRNAGVEYHAIDMLFGTIGTLGWLWVSVIWQDRAMIILNALMVLLLGSGLLKIYLI